MLGEIVQYRQPLDNRGKKEFVDWPAIIYKVFVGEEGLPVGLSVFVEGQPMRFGKVVYSKEPADGCWSWLQTKEAKQT